MVKGIIGNTLTTPIAPLKKVSQLENDAKYATADDVSSVEATAQDARRMAEWADGTANEARTIAVHNAENKADKSELPKKVSELENDAEYVTGGQVSQMDYSLYNFIMGDVNTLLGDKVDKPTIKSVYYPFDFSTMYNTELRTTSEVGDTLDSLSFTFGNGEYPQDYISGISFDSGETPTAIDYTDSGILNWVGTDCSTFTYQINPEGDIATISLFIPSPNTHYDIVFYFNGNQFIGLVNGFVPATRNEAV